MPIQVGQVDPCNSAPALACLFEEILWGLEWKRPTRAILLPPSHSSLHNHLFVYMYICIYEMHDFSEYIWCSEPSTSELSFCTMIGKRFVFLILSLLSLAASLGTRSIVRAQCRTQHLAACFSYQQINPCDHKGVDRNKTIVQYGTMLVVVYEECMFVHDAHHTMWGCVHTPACRHEAAKRSTGRITMSWPSLKVTQKNTLQYSIKYFRD